MDQKSGEKSAEPLLTLSATRQGRANFGIHLYALEKKGKNGSSNGQPVDLDQEEEEEASKSFWANDPSMRNNNRDGIHVGHSVHIVSTKSE